MKLRFTKMHGLGNDFVVINAITQPVALTAAQIRRIADRHFGVGCDQLLLVEQSTSTADFRYRIFNADGSEVEQCGNGARCFVRFVHDQGLTAKTEIQVETAGGIIAPKLVANGMVTVNMGQPRFAPADIPFVADKVMPTYELQVADQSIAIAALSLGNPHAVQIVDDVDQAPIALQGPLIESHVRFPQRVNAGFMQIVNPHHIRLRVYERGSGETLACGTGACAAVVAGINQDRLHSPVRVSTHGGELEISWGGAGEPVWMTGPAETVFEGELDVNTLHP